MTDFDSMPTLGAIARHYARLRPTSVAMSFEGRETSYHEFNRHSNQVAHALAVAGAKRADRIAYVGKNSDQYFELVFGAAKAGVVLTPVGWRLTPAEMAFIIEDCGASIVFIGAETMSQVEQALSGLKRRPKVIAMDQPCLSPHELFETWRDTASGDEVDLCVDEHDVALQLYTSGTTGRPKGVMLTHANLLRGRRAAARARLSWFAWKPDDISLVAMPVAHVGGTVWGVIGLYHGVKSIILREFDPEKVLDCVERDRISQLFMVPAALQLVARSPRARDIDYSALKCILYGASPMPIELLRECIKLFECAFCQQYGMTETSGTIVYLPPEDHHLSGNARMRGAGLPMPGVEISIVDSHGNALPPNTVGEVVTRSAANMAGYWRNSEATDAVVDAQGWLRTGDAGYLDEDGYLYIHDRVKDMIISGAENVYPAEVENAIYGHPHVVEVAVIGVPDEKWGEAVKAIVVPKPGVTPDPDGIIEFARARIAGFKVPKSIDFVNALPRNASGKILRRTLREPYWFGRDRQVN
ncbi:fatty acid--CoA ligase [Paraburkholderia elongata]|uniref:Long-chain-fatty-acid--CoA ligase n=1 Tax=Paraburkholderia elongata TaxID=2675747 RepID=A0A972NRN9_9BURK|nr:fatty acid--CoA ligase [Paraburkholderia elongata]NPT56420.1 long-chain-fatty-acid--CoA ligase [Paraburkholderia elongata]